MHDEDQQQAAVMRFSLRSALAACWNVWPTSLVHDWVDTLETEQAVSADKLRVMPFNY